MTDSDIYPFDDVDEIDMFVCHLKHVAKNSRGFDFDCLEGKSREEAYEILEKHFSREEMRQATLGYVARTLSSLECDSRSSDPHESSPASQERDSRPIHQSMPGIGKAA